LDQLQNNKYNIKSIIKAFNILELLVENEKLSIGELNDMTTYGKSTVHRLVGTLKQLNYVDQDIIDGKYFMTIKIFEMGNRVANRIPIKNIAQPYLEELYEKCKETVNLGILDNNEVIYLNKIVTEEPLRINLDVGRRIPVYCSALGKAILAFNEETDISKLKFQKFTGKTIESVENLKNELENIRKFGYSYDDEEYIEGLVCIARPILDNNGNAIAAISIAIPKTRLTDEKKQKYFEILKETANKIQNKNGVKNSI